MKTKLAPFLALCALVAAILPARADTATFASAELLCRKISSGNCGQNTEPDVKVDPEGNAYNSAIIGVPGGTNFWRRPAGEQTFRWAGMPEAMPQLAPRGYALGGGDTALAVATARNSAGFYNVYMASLFAAGVTVATSKDGGKTWSLNVISAPITADRQWMVASGSSTVWLAYQDFARGSLPVVERSDDAGATFGPPIDAYDANAQQRGLFYRARFGSLTLDPSNGMMYWPFASTADVNEAIEGGIRGNPFGINSHVVYMNVSADGGQTWTTHRVYAEPLDTRVDAIFPWSAVDAAGTLYTVWSTTHGVYMTFSTDRGSSWSARVKVSQAPVNSVVLPTIVGGRAGTVDIGFVGTDATNLDDETAAWRVYFVQSLDATAPDAHFTQVEASPSPIHVGSVCLRGLGCDLPAPAGQPGDRSLSEILTITLDHDGMALLASPYDSLNGVAKSGTQSLMMKQLTGSRAFDSTEPVIGLSPEPK